MRLASVKRCRAWGYGGAPGPPPRLPGSSSSSRAFLAGGAALAAPFSLTGTVGFVPPLHVSGEWYVVPRWLLMFDLEGLAGGPGRAVDATAKVGYDPGVAAPWRGGGDGG